METRIQRMAGEHGADVAALHIAGIDRGFLTRLGPKFLADLYGAINDSPLGFVFVALDPHDAVLGFVSGTTSVRRLYRSLLLRRGWRYVGMVVRSVFNREGLRRVVETVLYPVRGDHSAADAELLSIVVGEEARGTDVAAGLLAALLNEFRERGCRRAKLVVNAELVRAHAFYRKHGFVSAGTILHHGCRSNVLVIDIDAKTGPLGRDLNGAGTP